MHFENNINILSQKKIYYNICMIKNDNKKKILLKETTMIAISTICI